MAEADIKTLIKDIKKDRKDQVEKLNKILEANNELIKSAETKEERKKIR